MLTKQVIIIRCIFTVSQLFYYLNSTVLLHFNLYIILPLLNFRHQLFKKKEELVVSFDWYNHEHMCTHVGGLYPFSIKVVS